MGIGEVPYISGGRRDGVDRHHVLRGDLPLSDGNGRANVLSFGRETGGGASVTKSISSLHRRQLRIQLLDQCDQLLDLRLRRSRDVQVKILLYSTCHGW